MTDVADRAGRVWPVGNGAERGGLKATLLAQVSFVCVTLLLSASPVESATTEFVVPSGPLITFQDGRALEGHIVRIDQTNVVIQTSDGGTEILPRSTVDNVAFETVTGQLLVGELVGWTAGVYQLATPEAAIKVYSTMPAASTQPDSATAADIVEREDVVQEGSETAADAGQGSSQSIAAVKVDETTANGVDDDADSGIESQDAAIATSELSIQVSVENSKENGPPVAFNIELSEPSDSSIVLIYATIDGTAINGEDYEANRGVVVIKPGEQVARIEAPVIDDTELEEQEHLQLFLTVDPTVAVVENRQIIATIDDDDQS